MPDVKFKKGQKVTATTKSGEKLAGTYVTEHPGLKGSYHEVDHGKKQKRYRLSAVAAA